METVKNIEYFFLWFFLYSNLFQLISITVIIKTQHEQTFHKLILPPIVRSLLNLNIYLSSRTHLDSDMYIITCIHNRGRSAQAAIEHFRNL